MNLHSLVAGAIGTVNPFIPITIQQSAGYTTSPDGSQVPAFTTLTASGQVQALSGGEIQRLANLGIQGQMRKIYMSGDWEGIVRAEQKGGDLFLFNGQKWLAVQVLETWPDWSAVAVCRQL